MKHDVSHHCGGATRVPQKLRGEIAGAIDAISVKPERGSAPILRAAFLVALKSLGWSSEVAVAKGSDITITSMKDGVGLCLQTGNTARMYADLIKLQTLYLDGAIQSAAIVLPSEPVAKLLGSNVAQANRLSRELEIFKKAYNVPTLIFALG